MTWLISGSIVVDGHELHEEDLRLMYTFNQAPGSAAQYEAHSDSQVFLIFKSVVFIFNNKLHLAETIVFLRSIHYFLNFGPL